MQDNFPRCDERISTHFACRSAKFVKERGEREIEIFCRAFISKTNRTRKLRSSISSTLFSISISSRVASTRLTMTTTATTTRTTKDSGTETVETPKPGGRRDENYTNTRSLAIGREIYCVYRAAAAASTATTYSLILFRRRCEFGFTRERANVQSASLS